MTTYAAIYSQQLTRLQAEIIRKEILPYQERMLNTLEQLAFGERAVDLSFAPRYRYAYLASLSRLAGSLA